MHHLTVAMGTHLPKISPLIFVTGYPKSGTSWACQLVADYLQLPFPQFYLLPIAFRAVVHGHELPHPARKSFYLMRDGRDVVVSEYFHHWRALPEGAPRGLDRRQRRLFPELRDREDHRANLPRFLQAQARRPVAAPVPWGGHVLRSLDLEGEAMVVMRYEDLLTDAAALLAASCEALLGEEADLERASSTVAKFTFEKQSGRKPGQTDTASFLRQGRAGDWRNHFDRATAELFHALHGEGLIRAGYEPDASWVERCPEVLESPA
ncbi:MAG: sulfotransferase domain-containing protein [Deltaproteobacteria bacterium]|nr:sulfotransferase domain-containing protein [Deltaproteobacteria bacterium]